MDWKNAKTILILVFLILNIILTVILYRNVKGEEVSQETIYNTQKILEQNNVHIECAIPRYTGTDYILQHDETILDRSKIVSAFLGDKYSKISDSTYVLKTQRLVFANDSTFEYSDSGVNNRTSAESKSGIESFVKELSKKLDIPLNEFQLDEFGLLPGGEGTRAVYKGVYKGYSVFDNYIELIVSKSSLKSLKYHYKRPMTITNRDINVIPVYQILITKMTAYPGIYIKEVDMGFKGLTQVDKETKTLYEGLSWRIKTSEGKEFYFNATNGERME